MGIIQKQALQTTAITFIGIAIGFTSQILMPFILSQSQIGTLSLLNSISNILATIFSLGFVQITIRMFSNFRNEKKGHFGFLMFGLFFSILGILLAGLTFYFFQNIIIGTNTETKIIRSIAYLVFPLIFFRIIFKNLDTYLRMLFSTVVGAFLEGLLLKLILLIGIICFWLNLVDYKSLAFIYTFALSLPGLIIIILAFSKTKRIVLPQKELFLNDNKSKMFNNALFGVLGSASGIIVFAIDQLMINRMIGTDAVGIYSIMFFAGMLVSIPSRGVKRIAVPILAESWKSNNMKSIKETYTKSIVAQSTVGFYLFIVGWASIPSVLVFLPDYSEGLYAFFFIGTAQLIDMMTGVNVEIIATSPKYKFNTYFNVVLAILIIILNYFFIQYWGIVGAALSTAVAMTTINIARAYYLKRAYDFRLLSLKFAKVLMIGTIFLIIVSFINIPLNPILSIILKTISITLAYWFIIIKLNLSPEINALLIKLKSRFFPKT